jgi:RNase adaptor protein for sRNA GlmZ degradation
MPKPKFETWFMEGQLIPNYHYIAIKEDYSDLEEQLNYYIKNTKEAKAIINNANKHVAQFKNKLTEDLISLLVIKKYFEKTGQL